MRRVVHGGDKGRDQIGLGQSDRWGQADDGVVGKALVDVRRDKIERVPGGSLGL